MTTKCGQTERPQTERPRFPTAPGDGIVEFTFERGKTALRTMRSTYPLKMMHLRGTPRTRAESEKVAEGCAELSGAEWVYMLGHGGGVVSGDVTRVKICVGDGCTAVATTQAFTKVYKNHKNQFARQFVRAEVGAGGLLVMLPDPVVPYKDSRFVQNQQFLLAPSRDAMLVGVCGGGQVRDGAGNGGPPAPSLSLVSAEERLMGGSLVVVDWMTCGRGACGERWQMEHYESVNRVRVGSKWALHDAVRLSRDPLNSALEERMKPFDCLAMVALVGPRTEKLCTYLSELIKTRQTEAVYEQGGQGLGKRRRHPGEGEETPWDGLICSTSPLADAAGLVVRVAGHDYERVQNFLRTHLKGLEEQCGRDVWTKKMSLH